MKRVMALFVLLALLGGLPAMAEEAPDPSVLQDRLLQMSLRQDVITRSVLGVPRGTVFPVYSAPFDDAWQPAEGKARVSAEEPFTLLGTAERGAWSMIEYSLSGGSKRIGWACLPNIDPGWGGLFPSDDARLWTLIRDASLTDDPNGTAAAVLKMRAGDAVTALGLMGPWAYVQTETEGRTAWLFMEADALRPEPCWTVDSSGILTVREGITRVGGALLENIEDENGEFQARMVPLRKDDRSAPALVREENVPPGVRGVVLPSSLRSLGAEAFVYGQYDFIRLTNLPDGAAWDAFYAVRVGRMILPKDCVEIGSLRMGEYLTVGAWEVEEGNPVFSSRDGVLFSADGKKLIAYPNGAEAEHYTVPAGVEEIGESAFHDDAMGLPLKTVSLPIGLKRIGDHAFSDCGRLISLAVPLTVTGLSENAFSHCVSLERLSLPPGLAASFNDGWAERGDFTHYNGDNGTTAAREAAPREDEHPVFRARLDPEDGTGPVPWYSSSDAPEPAGETPAGTVVYLEGAENGRAAEQSWDAGSASLRLRWYALENLQPLTGEPFFTWADPGETLRTRTGDSRTLGLVTAEEPLSPVGLLDRPEGSEQMHLYPGEQAEVLEGRDGWLRVRTVFGEGWIPAGSFKEVPQAEP